jgi:hypothetical protein
MSMLRFAVLLLLVSACGRTDHDGAAASTPDRAGAGGRGSGGAASVAGAAGAVARSGAGGSGGATERNCLFPVAGLEIAPTSDKPAQRYGLSQPYSISTTSQLAQFAAAYEVNGDAVSDLLLLDAEASPPRFRLLLTSPPPDVLELVESDCAALRSLPAGRLLLRDLDGDGVQDFVVSRERGVLAYLNHEQGLVEVLRYDWPAPTLRAPLINLGVADLNGDERADLVMSVDRVLSEATIDFEIRVQAFLQEGASFVAGLAVVTSFSSGQPESPVAYTGYMTAGRFKPDESGTALLIGQSPLASDFRALLETRFDGSEPRRLPGLLGEHMQQVFALPRADAISLVLAVGETQFGLLELNGLLPSNPPTFGPVLVTQGELAFLAGSSHELGGGSESPRHFVYDVDRDGDLDFLESDPSNAKLALHVNHANQSFDAPQLLDINVWGGAETPFIQLGPGGAVIGRPAEGGFGLAVYVFVAEPE